MISRVANCDYLRLMIVATGGEVSMKLTRASTYATHALVYMAQQKHSKPVPSHLIAKERGIPERFLLKVLKPLVSARILVSIKGPNGGYRLAKPANDVNLLEVVEAVDGPMRGHSPLSHNEGDSALNRKLDTICKQSADQTRKHLEKVHLNELAGKK
jgi:Rrf2 family protein